MITDNDYWELYDDQDPKKFDYIQYPDRTGNLLTKPILADTFFADIAEIRRQYGDRTIIKMCKYA